MKKQLLRYSLIVIISVIILAIVNSFFKSEMQKIKTGIAGKINAVCQHQLDVPISIWGASTAYVNFDANLISKKLNESVFNMGIDGTNIDQYDGLLKEYLSYTKKSKKIILAFDIHGGFTKRNSIYNIHLWNQNLENHFIRSSFQDVDPVLIKKIKWIPFYNLTLYNKHSFSLVLENWINPLNEFYFPNSGFQSNHKSNGKISNQPDNKISLVVNHFVIQKTLNICNVAKDKNIEPIIILTPCFEKGYERITNPEIIDSLKMNFNKLGIKTFDFSQSDFSKNPLFFLDNTHLSEQGAKEFSKIVSDSLNYYFQK